ncbi:uncharacterized protein MYCFIDRAFT_85485 [Pseudocercospora fijiensis CIRAD86]|uniref:Ecp2 effector protein domain-containing protein n=1 Tax=Pseudocercospora fijiensis (strain CIRAD86) TaxID=383855 RepID=M3AVQ1_PSEFD|nr:uncharacterized protein MYCFIDRAFT_85485 [Pseudocercospora fijiensis CIRAD86]EME81208.1 hypothetical protein MYCFIDRAFT_85485 [Pseudocercospora fijiensis CIRAD86]
MAAPVVIIFACCLSNIPAVFATPATSQVDPNFFPGVQTGLGSWFRAHNTQDHTNGHSWCNYPYTDDDPIFALCLSAMGGATFYTNETKWSESMAKYCSLEAKVTDPSTGKSMLLYIGDSFEDAYCQVRFKQLHGDPHDDKHNDINNVQWKLTGNKNARYSAPKA